MTRQERLDVGEKIFVGAFVGSVVIEVLLAIFAAALTDIPLSILTTLLLGSIFAGFLLYLANWLYSGNLTAWKVSIGWAVFQVLLSGGIIAVFLADQNSQIASYLGLPDIWLAIIKAVTYTAFAVVLTLPQPVRDFLGLRRGEPVPDNVEAAAIPVSGVTVPLSEDQAKAFGSLACWMQWAGGLLLVAGVLRFGVGLLALQEKDIWPGVPTAVEGVAVAVLGVLLLAPASALRLFQARDMNHLMYALKSLRSLYFKQLILVGIIHLAVVLGIVLAVLAMLK